MTRTFKGLRGQLVQYLRQKNDWVPKGTMTNDIVWTNSKNGTRYIADSVGSHLRWLERNCIIAVKPDYNKKSVVYKYIPDWPEHLRRQYIPTSERPKGQEHVLMKPLPQQPTLEEQSEVSEEEIMSYMNGH